MREGKKPSTPLPLWETQLHADFRRLGRQCFSDTLKIADNEQPTSKSCINYRLNRFPVNPPGASSGRDCWETLSKSAPQTPQLCRFFLRFFLFFPSLRALLNAAQSSEQKTERPFPLISFKIKLV